MIPEFLLEYNYIFNNPINISSDNNITMSSFTNKIEFKNDLVSNLNTCFDHLAENVKVNLYIDKDYLDKYKSN